MMERSAGFPRVDGISDNILYDEDFEGLVGGGDDAKFDAAQYEFFGKNAMEVELNGLEDDGDASVYVGLHDEDSLILTTEGESFGYSSEIDDLTNSFLKLNKDATQIWNSTAVSGKALLSKESSAVADRSSEFGLSTWSNQNVLDVGYAQDTKRWQSDPYSFSSHFVESNPPSRKMSLPYEQQQNQLNIFEQVSIPKSLSTSYPLPSGLPHSSQLLPHTMDILSQSPGLHNAFPFSSRQPSSADVYHGLNNGRNMAQFVSPSLPINNQEDNNLIRQSSLTSGDAVNLFSGFSHPSIPLLNGLITAHQPRFPNVQPFSQLHHQLSRPNSLSRFSESMAGMTEWRDHGLNAGQRGRGRSPAWPQFRSKYMLPEEIDSILRIQHAATHSSDPYSDDYYHQACVAKRFSGSKLPHQFCPTFLGELPSKSRGSNEPHAFLQIDALGRIPFSSIHRPRPLLDMESPSTGAANKAEQKCSLKPLEQEPMLAVRIIIEDGLCTLLDVDDIDRHLRFSQQHDSKSLLMGRRETLLEGLVASLQLVDPLEHKKTGQSVGITLKNDIVFLRMVSLPKGRKFLSRYLLLLYPGSRISRIICMAIFRHLRFLFGSLPSDIRTAETSDLAIIVTSCISGMDLSALSACLAAVVCSSEHPPLRPIGSAAGDGASIVIRSVVERATELLKDHHTMNAYSFSNRSLWQESFNAFFELLLNYCLSKYESIAQRLFLNSQDSSSMDGSEATYAIREEMPVELLRASLPHTDEQQRKLLLELSRRAMPVAG